ncbi:MAG TPA: hypothetical protein VN026_03260 [Bacteroidia bacterium]|nr:hypothetical protein [Bacteroidia bacterium]
MPLTTTARPKAKFRASFSTLFAILRIGVANYADNQPAFLLKNPIWTVLWGTDMLTDVTSVNNMPDEFTRAAQIAEIKDIYDTNVVSSISSFADLNSLIEQSFPESQWKTKAIEAGSKHWGKAAVNAGKCTLGLSAGVLFITNNHAALLAGGMITTFQADFTTLSTNDGIFGPNYKNAEVEAHLQTDAKIIACNDLYTRYMVMAKVAKNIFRNDKAMKNGFVYGTIKKTINPQHQVLETVKIKKESSKTIHNAVIDAVITNTGTRPVLVCPGKLPCTLAMPEDKPVEETKETVQETKEPITAKEETKAAEENKATEKEETVVEETKTLLTTGTLLMPEETMINTLGEIITFTVSDPLVGSQVSIKRTVNEK